MPKSSGQVFEVSSYSAARRQPRILDVLRGVKSVAPRHGDVVAWWYAPPRRLRLRGELPSPERPPVEVVVEVRGMELVTARAIAAELSRELNTDVSVRLHRGAEEDRKLFRLVSAPDRASVG